MVLKTKPPPGAKISHRLRTCSRTSAGVPNGKTFCVSTPPPQKTNRSPKFAFNCCGSIPAAEHCTGLRMSKPASIKDGINLDGTARMFERFPECMGMNPVVELFVVREVQSAEGFH